MDRNKVAGLLEEYGGAYGMNHTRRILHIVSEIGSGMDYSEDIVWVSAHLHDWGGYPRWAVPDVDHALRSAQVAGAFLEAEGYPEASSRKVVECIENHHNGRRDKCLEAQLLSDADGIDYLGIVGVLREFSTKPREMRIAFDSARNRMARLRQSIILDSARRIAEKRLAEMESLLFQFEEEAFGLF